MLITRRFSEWIDECERVNTVDDDGVPVEDDEVDVDYRAVKPVLNAWRNLLHLAVCHVWF
ncbi:putative transcription elongation factor 1 [Helianthus debilis subsp. tardiflorus]